MATIRCKNVDGKGRVIYVEYEIEEASEDDEITAEEALEIIRGGVVNV